MGDGKSKLDEALARARARKVAKVGLEVEREQVKPRNVVPTPVQKRPYFAPHKWLCRVGQTRTLRRPWYVDEEWLRSSWPGQPADAEPMQKGAQITLIERTSYKRGSRSSTFRAWILELQDGRRLKAFQADLERFTTR